MPPCQIPLLTLTANDTICSLLPKMNAFFSEQWVSASYSQLCGDALGTLTFTKNCGGMFQVQIPAMEDEIISGLNATIQPHNALLVDVMPGVFNLCGQQYQLNAPVTLNVGVGDPTLPRIDTIYIDNTSTVILLPGTPAFIPVAPTPPANSIVVAYVFVNAQASAQGVTFLQSGVQEVPRGTLQHSTLRWNGIAHQEDTLFQHDGTARCWYGASTDIQMPSGAGTRLVFLSDAYSAFRAGFVSGIQWDLAKIGQFSFAANRDTIASGQASTAFGEQTEASGINAFSCGAANFSSGINSFTGNIGNQAQGYASAAFCNNNFAIGQSSFAKGEGCQAIGQSSSAEGGVTTALGSYSHAEGLFAQSIGFASHVEGNNSLATGDYSHAEGDFGQAIGLGSHAGSQSIANGLYSFAHGAAQANGAYSVAMGSAIANGFVAVALGCGTANGFCSFSCNQSLASGFGSFASGQGCNSVGSYSSANNYLTQAFGFASHAEGGNFSQAIGDYSHAQNNSNNAIGFASHAGGNQSVASGTYSFVHGDANTVSGVASALLAGRLQTLTQDYTLATQRFRFNGGLQVKAIIIIAPVYLLGLDDYFVKFTHFAPTATLPPAPVQGQTYLLVRGAIGATLTINGNGNNINGAATYTLGITGAPLDAYNAVKLTWDGIEWIALYHPSINTI